MIWFVLLFSFLLEAAFTNIVSTNSFLIPLFSITSLVLIYPYFKNKNINYFIVCLILGSFYDIVFADSIFVNIASNKKEKIKIKQIIIPLPFYFK